MIAKNLLTFFSSLIFASSVASQIPEAPINVSYYDLTQTSVVLQWADPFPSPNLAGYNIYMDQELFSTADIFTRTLPITGLIQYTPYSFGVSSRDAAGNESDIIYTWFRTAPACNVTNNWIGNSSRWANDSQNWSNGHIPNACDDVLIDNGAIVTAANDIPSNSVFNREYLVETFEVGLGSGFSVDPGAEFHVIPSQAGPYTISGTYEDLDRDCDDGMFCECCQGLSIIDNQTCIYFFTDIQLLATYSITDKIITVRLVNFSGTFFYRIIDNNNIVEIGTTDVLTKN